MAISIKTPSLLKEIGKYAKSLDIPITEAAERLLTTAISRRAALTKYGKSNKGKKARKAYVQSLAKKTVKKMKRSSAYGKKPAKKSAAKAKTDRKASAKPRMKKAPAPPISTVNGISAEPVQ